MQTAENPTQTKRHRVVLISPSGEEFFEAYGPMTKDKEKATVFYTNPKTLREPQRFGNSGTEFWQCERDSAAMARTKYKGWTFRIEPLTNEEIAEHIEAQPIRNHRFHVGLAPFVAADKSTYATYNALNADSKSEGVVWVRDGKILDSIILSNVDAEAFKKAALDHFAVQSPTAF